MHCFSVNDCNVRFLFVVQIWMLRYGGYVLNLRQLITNGLTAADQFSMLALDHSSGPNQKAFAVCKRSVAVSFLFSGVVHC